ncbi:hydrogenase 3 maturation endopeptidase HyCI [Ornatilinea apprima]|uniref:hydrogenase 3 maturation endopeptidase HyCI n=1 Tax=Ornatilinea apprima TaxID=1134406 RepID=UPI001364D9D1|nr:hydrogenase 3 maturation endopeptidase HyCI [Ornatilinea apprima]
MSEPSWSQQLQNKLKSPAPNQPDPRVVILGVGNELNGDDRAGVAVAEFLQAQLNNPRFLVLNGGNAPENYVGKVIKFAPQVVLLIDAADLGEPPGAVRLVEWDETQGLSASTHSLPPSVMAKYLIAELGCQVLVLAIQAGSLELMQPLTPPVAQAVGEIVETLSQI